MRRPKQIIKRIADFAMIVLLPVLMAEILTGQEVHEYLGTVMLALFLAHHLLNLGWWRNFYKGKYTPVRAFGTALDLLLLLDMMSLGVSGIMMSDFVFRFLNLRGGMLLARQLHLFASHWGLILMSAHLGMHMRQFFGMGRKLFGLSEKNAARTRILRLVAGVLSVYGIYAFITQHMTDYLFLQTHFVMFDETKPAAVYFVETVTMIILFAAAAHYINRLPGRVGRKTEEERPNGRGWKVLAFAVPMMVCILVVAALNLPSQREPWQSNPAETAVDDKSTDTTEVLTDESSTDVTEPLTENRTGMEEKDGFVFIKGGSYFMGSPEDEPWRSEDEARHTVTVSDFYMSPFEVRQSEYLAVMDSNPSSFSGDDLPVENISWLDAIAFCNALSEEENLTAAYTIDGETVTWDRSANGYRLSTEAAVGMILRKICARPTGPLCRRIRAASISASDLSGML